MSRVPRSLLTIVLQPAFSRSLHIYSCRGDFKNSCPVLFCYLMSFKILVSSFLAPIPYTPNTKICIFPVIFLHFAHVDKGYLQLEKTRFIGRNGGLVNLGYWSIDLFNNNDAILNFEHIAVHCGLSRVI